MNEFESLGLSQELVKAVDAMGFVTPTPIQSKTIPILLEDERDFIGLAQTGTGKTAAFGLPLIDLIDKDASQTQAVILAPTRELCIQITKELNNFGKNLKKLRIVPVYGGTDIRNQIRDIKRGAHIIVATPGRLRDMINRKAVNLREIDWVVLDEADEMLNMGFKEEIDAILEGTPEDKLTWLFSATMPQNVRRIARNYMEDPFELKIGTLNSSNKDIEHQYTILRPSQRYEALRRYLDYELNIFALVFTRTRRDAKEVAERLNRDGYAADALHGDLTQGQRDYVMGGFRSRRLKILVATDVAARGIDVDEVTHVFHYNIPEDISFYTHRAGRTGRAGNKGLSIVFTHPKDAGILRLIERRVKIKFTKAHIPTGQEVCDRRLEYRMARIKETEVSKEVEAIMPKILAEIEDLTKEELMEKFATLSFTKFLKQYRRAEDLNIAQSRPQRRPERRGRGGNVPRQRLFMNIGSIDVRDKAGFLSLLCKDGEIPGYAVGKIDMHEKFTFVEIEEDFAERVIRRFKNASFQGRPIRINSETRRGGGGNRNDRRYSRRKKYSRR